VRVTFNNLCAISKQLIAIPVLFLNHHTFIRDFHVLFIFIRVIKNMRPATDPIKWSIHKDNPHADRDRMYKVYS
jgi:hypothetical protein